MTHQKTGKLSPICKGKKTQQSPNVGISENFKAVIINMLKIKEIMFKSSMITMNQQIFSLKRQKL